MIFAQYSYKNFHDENTDKHPVQPYSLHNWCKMVNDNDEYCLNMNWLKWIEVYFWVAVGRIRFSDLSASHQYWDIQVSKREKKDLKRLKEQYNICKKNPDQIKILFNLTTSLQDIREMINGYNK